MKHVVDFKDVSIQGLENAQYPESLAGLRANEARYFMNKYNAEFVTESAGDNLDIINYVNEILKNEKDIVIKATPLEVSSFIIEEMKVTYMFYDSGLSINVIYSLPDVKKRAVGLKLSENMEIPAELATKFKFGRQKSKLAGIIRGSYFIIKNEY